MRCEDVKVCILDGIFSVEVKEHLHRCSPCSSFYRSHEAMRKTIKNGLDVACSLSGKEVAVSSKPGKRRVKPLLAVASILLAILILTPFVSPTVAKQLARLPFISLLIRDSALLGALDEAEQMEYTVVDQGITFKVHNVIADSVRLAATFSIEGYSAEDHSIEIIINERSLWGIGSKSIGYQVDDQGNTHGYVVVEPSAYGYLEYLPIELRIEGNDGEWKLDVPIEVINESDYKVIRLHTEESGIDFSVDELAFGITGTRLMWSITNRDTYPLNADGEPITGFGLGNRLPDRPFEVLLVEPLRVQLLDKKGMPYSLGRGTAFSSRTSSATAVTINGNDLYPPIFDRDGLTVRAEGMIVVDTEPFIINLHKHKGTWSNPVAWLHHTLISVEEFSLTGEEAIVSLSLMHGDLARLDSFYLMDDKGNRYELRNKEFTIPGLEDLVNEHFGPHMGEDDYKKFLQMHKNLKKEFTLRFEAPVLNVSSLSLHVDTVLYRSDTVLEINIPAP
ncbi:MAG: DUF4179 domain-containing protein [Firmicutes bacterium]|nr:DUF4179 domain-containing protein [Bacillota bacterium]